MIEKMLDDKGIDIRDCSARHGTMGQTVRLDNWGPCSSLREKSFRYIFTPYLKYCGCACYEALRSQHLLTASIDFIRFLVPVQDAGTPTRRKQVAYGFPCQILAAVPESWLLNLEHNTFLQCLRTWIVNRLAV